MTYAFTPIKDKPELGDHGSPLPNMKPITERDFMQSWFFVYCPEFSGYRQIVPSHLKELGIDQLYNFEVRWYMFHDKRGVAIGRNRERLLFFKFAVCEHDYSSKTIGNCLTEYVCKKCDHKETVDSSG